MVNPKPDKTCLKRFAASTGAFFGIIFGLFFPYVFDYSFPLWPWVVISSLSFVAFTAPVCLGPVYQIWTNIILSVGNFNSTIIMGIIFYCVTTPMAFLMRLTGWDPMKRNFDETARSYRIPSSPTTKDDFNHPF